MYPHRIRLRGPWTCEPLFRFTDDGGRSTADLPPAFRMTMPGRWSDAGLHDFRGGMRCGRRFGYPGRIDDFERVWLTFAGLDGCATITVNDTIVGSIAGPSEFEITSLLSSRNRLTVDIESSECSAGLWGEVALEIRATAFLRGVEFQCQADGLTAAGSIVGTAPRPLDLYLFAADRFLLHQHVNPSPEGQAFALTSDLPDEITSPSFPVRVELVDAATIWYVVEGTVNRPQTKPASGSSY